MKRLWMLVMVMLLALGVCSTASAGEYGYANEQGEMVIPAQWDYAYPFKEGLGRVFVGTINQWGYPEAGHFGFVDQTGRMAVDVVWEHAYDFQDGLALVTHGQKYGFINQSGEIVVPVEYDYAVSYANGHAVVFTGTMEYGQPKEGEYVLLDTTGYALLTAEPGWSYVRYVGEGMAAYKQEGRFHLINITTRETLPGSWDSVGSFHEGLCWVEKDDLYGYVNTDGDVVVECQYDTAGDFAGGLALVRRDGVYAMIDPTGTAVVQLDFDYISTYSAAGYAYAFRGSMKSATWPDSANGQYWVIDAQGQIISEPVKIEDFFAIGQNGWRVQQNEKWGLLSHDGQWLIQPSFDKLYGDGSVLVYRQGDSYGLVSAGGKVITPAQWADAQGPTEGLVAVKAWNAETEADFRKTRWGMSQQQVMATESGSYAYQGKISGLDAWYIGYDTTVMGLDCILEYYFCDDGLYEARYILTEEHSNASMFIQDYETMRAAFTKKYGEPSWDQEIWDTSAHKSYYAIRKGDALTYGYLTYRTLYFTERTSIKMNMQADNDEISTVIRYMSVDITPGEPDYSDEI